VVAGPNGSLVPSLTAASYDVTVLPLDELEPSAIPLGGSPALQQSCRLDHWLHQHSFDLVYLPLEQAPGYFSLLQRQVDEIE
jgi:hypothetical protein